MRLAAGDLIGPYEVLGPIGAGGMGEVFRARDTRLGREVAIKVLPESFARDPERLARLRREAQALAALNHPHVATLYGLEEAGGATALVMELVEGESLADRVAARPLSPEAALPIARQIAEALAAAHGKGIVHRDLKPANVRLDAAGKAKLLDFGLARLAPQTGQLGAPQPGPGSSRMETQIPQTEAGTVLGTPTYMSPEQVCGEVVDERSDVWSFGALLYELLAGRPPFAAPSTAETLSAILRDPTPPLRIGSGPPPLAALLESVVARCLQKQPSRRYLGGLELCAALAQAPGPRPQERSLLVLPFDNLSPDPENAYFADGLVEELISDLGRIRALRVISRTSAMALRGARKDLPTLGRELSVRYVVEGSVRRAGNQVRITASLADVETDASLWSEKYTGTTDDVFDLQERISRTIVEALRVTLTPDEERKLRARPVANVRAWECYLRARQEVVTFESQAQLRALALVREARQFVGENALLHALEGYIHWNRKNLGVASGEEALPLAGAAADRALALDPDCALASLVKGLVVWTRPGARGAVQEALPYLERSLALEENPDVLSWSILALSEDGQDEVAERLAARLLAIDPLTPTAHAFAALPPLHLGDFERALERMGRCAEMAPQFSAGLMIIGQTLGLSGREEEALSYLDRAAADPQAGHFQTAAAVIAHAIRGEGEKARAGVKTMDEAGIRSDDQFSWLIASAMARLGDRDTALDWLGNAVRRGYVNWRFLGQREPWLGRLRGDPRFEAILAEARSAHAPTGARP